MGARDEVNYTAMSDDELYTAFGVEHEQGHYEHASMAADEILRRSRSPAPVMHNVPNWLKRWIPGQFWHQKPEGEGSCTLSP